MGCNARVIQLFESFPPPPPHRQGRERPRSLAKEVEQEGTLLRPLRVITHYGRESRKSKNRVSIIRNPERYLQTVAPEQGMVDNQVVSHVSPCVCLDHLDTHGIFIAV